jgi:acetolactate synthase-1/2/3 large subunit
MEYFSDLIVDFLAQQGIEYVSFNPGASFRGVHDSLVAMRDREGTPRMLVSCHEEISVAIAHGYYKACGKHMAVLVHANIGLQHASMAIFNAWCDRVPLLVMGGNGPLDASKRRPWIDWIHTSQAIDSVVKDYVKWSDVPISQKATLESLYRGVRLMTTEANAPVFIALDAAVQEEVLEAGVTLYPATAGQPSILPAIDDTEAETLAANLLAASFPVLLVDLSGKDETVPALVSLAEELGIAIVDRGGRYNFPNTHPLSLVEPTAEVLQSADFILALEVQDLWGALQALTLRPVAELPQIVTLGSNDLLTSSWVADYQRLMPVNRALHANLGRSLKKILRAVRERLPASLTSSVRSERYQRISAWHNAARQEWRETARAHREDEVMHVTSALETIHEVLKPHDWMVANTGSVTIDGWVKRLWDLDRDGCYLGLSGGAGLGYGPGASIGAALAHKDTGRLCVNLQSDGDFLYTPSALWTLSKYDIPLLTIVMNNSLYLNSKQHAEIIATHRNRDVADADIGTSFHDNPVDFLALAKSFNIYASGRATDLAGLKACLNDAIDYIRTHGKPALVEVVMQ